MTATVHVLHSKPLSIGSFLRVGHTGHRKLEALIAASRLRFRRFASRLKFPNDDIAKLIDETKKRLTNLRDPLGDLHSASASATRSAAPRFRGDDQNSQSAVG
jgi:hypothetical protein